MLLPLRAEVEGFSSAEIGLTGSAYFFGFVIGCLITPIIVRRVGHIRSFAVLATLYSVLALAFHAVPIFAAWLLLRLCAGMVISGLYMLVESWLNDRATPQNRGTVLSIYMIINLLMTTVGQQLFNVAPAENWLAFGIAAILLSLAIIPVSLTLSLAPAAIHNVKLNLRQLWKTSHVAVMGSICSGLVTGAFWSMGPIYAQGIGLESFHLTLFMSVIVIGGAIFQFPLGRMSDHYDRRVVLLGSAVCGAVISLLLATIPVVWFWLALSGLLWGGCVMTLYAICLAHATDTASADDFVSVGGGMLLISGFFAAIGSPLASLSMSTFGPEGLFLFSAFCLFSLSAGILIRRRIHYIPLEDETEPFRAMVQTSPAALELDPRTEETETTESEDDEPSAST